MQCRNCGAELNDSARFCHQCGAAQQTGLPPGLPEQQTSVMPAAAVSLGQETAAAGAANTRKRRGCLGWGCLVTAGLLLVILLIGGWALARESGLLANLGLYRSPTERLVAPEPDRAAARAILGEMEGAGLDTTGMYLYVFPLRNSSQQIAYAVLDASAGFRFDLSADEDVIVVLLSDIATAESAASNGVTRVVIDYRDGEGNKMMALTAPVQAIRDYQNGAISREQFMQAVDADAELQDMLGVSGGLLP